MSSRYLYAVYNAPKWVLITLVRGYRLLLSPWLGSQCRFTPTCSVYAIEALERHGAACGSYLTGARLLRCHPFCAGGCDPVPQDLAKACPKIFSRFIRSSSVKTSP